MTGGRPSNEGTSPLLDCAWFAASAGSLCDAGRRVPGTHGPIPTELVS